MREEKVQHLNLGDLIPDWGYLLPDRWAGLFDTSQGITTLICSVLVVVFFCSIGYVLIQGRKTKKGIRFIEDNLLNINEKNLLAERENIRLAMCELQPCGKLWDEFDESLVKKDQILHNTIDAAHFFDTHTLARGVTESRLLAAVPGILTAIGVLGTFAGLTLGLGGLGEIGGGETKDLQNGIAGMIHAASIAFTTSFWGVFSSVIFNTYEKWVESRIRGKISNLQDRIDFLYPRLTPESMLLAISTSSQSSAEAMMGLAEQIGHKMQESMVQVKDDMNSSIADALQAVLAPALGQLAASSQDLAKRQGESSEAALSKLIEPFTKEMTQAGQAQAKMMSESALQFQNAAKDMQTHQSNAQLRAEAQAQSQMSKLTESTQDMMGMFKQSMVTLEQVNQQMLQGAREQIQSLQQQQALAGQEQQKSQAEASGLMMEQLQGFDRISRQNTDAAKAMIVQQETLLESLQLVTGDFSSLSNTVNQVCTQLQGTAEETKVSNAMLQQSSEFLSQTIAKVSQGNVDVAEKNGAVVSELNKLLGEVGVSRQAAENVVENLKAAAEFGKETFVTLQHHQQEYRNALTQHVEGLSEQLSKVVERHIREVEAQTTNRLQAWDKETMKYTDSMQGVVNVMQELVDDMDNKRG